MSVLRPSRKPAGLRDHHDRLKPASLKAEGFVRGLILWQHRRRAVCAITLATSMDTLQAGSRSVYTTPLAPDQDPALLLPPDRIEVCRVL